MVYRRRRTYRRKTTKRTYRPRRVYRRKKNLSGNNKVSYFTRYATGNQYGAISANAVTDTINSFNFSLNDVVNYTEFTALYDMYKINAVKITFLPQMTQNVSLTTANNPFANVRFYSAIDRNSANITTIDQLREYKTCKFTPILRPHKRYIHKPKILDSNGFSISPWLSTASPTVNYFGLYTGVEAIGSTITSAMSYTIEVKLYLAFKNVK